MAQINLKHSPNQQPFSAGNCHSRSLSQPQSFAINSLPPSSSSTLLPVEPRPDYPLNSKSNSVSMEEMDARLSSRGHRRVISDVPLGFSAMIRSSSQLVPISGQGSPDGAINMRKDAGSDTLVEGRVEVKIEDEVMDDMLDSFMNLDHADGEGEDAAGGGGVADRGNLESGRITMVSTSSKERVKTDSAENTAPQLRHCRSLSVDSSIGNFHFSCDWAGQLLRNNSLSENLARIDLDFGHGEFTEPELKRIMADERLAEIAAADPKRVKRILANRQSAARSKERKMHYISELEHKVRTLQTEATTLSATITVLQKDVTGLAYQNNELKLHIQAMQQQAQLQDALHEALTVEVEHLKVTASAEL